LDIILVSGATSRARTLTLDWRHLIAGSLALAFVVHRLHAAVQLRHAALRGGGEHPLLRAIVADQRQEALKTQQVVQGHLTAMAIAWASCSADAATGRPGERLAASRASSLDAAATVGFPAAAPVVAAVAAGLRRRVRRASGWRARSTSGPTS
jgi:hypothetical protein